MNEFLGKKNTLYFDDIALDKDFRVFLNDVLASDSISNMFSDTIKIMPLDSIIREDSYFPCITLDIINNGVDNRSSDSMQIQNRTEFTTEINIFTSGKASRTTNMRIANIIIQKMQMQFGLSFLQNQEVISPSSKITRRILRATNTIDNVNRIIY